MASAWVMSLLIDSVLWDFAISRYRLWGMIPFLHTYAAMQLKLWWHLLQLLIARQLSILDALWRDSTHSWDYDSVGYV